MTDHEKLETVLHDFVSNLHAYSNGAGKPDDYRRELAEAITKLEALLREARVDELLELESNGIGPDGFDGQRNRKKRIAALSASEGKGK